MLKRKRQQVENVLEAKIFDTLSNSAFEWVEGRSRAREYTKGVGFQ